MIEKELILEKRFLFLESLRILQSDFFSNKLLALLKIYTEIASKCDGASVNI